MSAKRRKGLQFPSPTHQKPERQKEPAAAGHTHRRWSLWILLPALLLATLAAYYPAWHGGVLWDDDAHVTRRDLRSTQGLSRIWFDLGASQQYYPVVHSAPWLQHKFWGDETLGYHLLNIILHTLAAMLFFSGTLFPVLGFFNVFPFRFSLVADHFQYLPGISIIVLISAGLASVARKWNIRFRPALAAAGMLALVGSLAGLTWSQSRQYAGAETLYRTTLDRNPSCWLAYNNLGVLKLKGPISDVPEAMEQIKQALKINPNSAGALNNLGVALERLGKLAEAATHFEEAVRLKPGFVEAGANLVRARTALKSGRDRPEAM